MPMPGKGKYCRYELHHPMSLSDFLAALFRGKPKMQHAATAEMRILSGRETVLTAPEPAVMCSREECDAVGAGHLELR